MRLWPAPGVKGAGLCRSARFAEFNARVAGGAMRDFRAATLCAAGMTLTRTQHSTMLTASPPSAVSLYLADMSAPVCRMVAMT